jgi:glucoamylase
MKGFVPIKNRPAWDEVHSPENIISTDALALVRFGLRKADDPRILNTVKIIDSILKTETATGPVWHRYNHDGYGEHSDGSPFDGTGTGRGWPLLSLERGHYELALGNKAKALELIKTVRNQTSPGGLLPEQVWDEKDIPERGLHNGKPSGSAMPLVWAHSEYIKLARSISDNKIFDMPPQTHKRYIEENRTSDKIIWSFTNKLATIEHGKSVRIHVLAKAKIHWSVDGWKTVNDTDTIDSGLGIYYADLRTGRMKKGESLVFTFFWIESGNWEGKDFTILVE